jgi:putative nucleotidyltransferase with HDIG domain
MSLGKRRSKLNRAHLRPSNPIDLQQGRSARQRERLARVAVVGVAVLATAAIVHGTGAPFTFRLGQRPSRELRVSVPVFQIKNQRKTTAEISGAQSKVVPIMNNDPAPVRTLAHQLVELADEVAQAPERDALPESVRSEWSLDQATFNDLSAATSTPEKREDLRRRIARAFEPVIRDGILGPDTLPRNEDAATSVRVRVANEGPDASILVPIDRVKSDRVAKLDGPVAQEFAAAFSSPQSLGQHLFMLVAEKLSGTPTLSYDEPATLAARKVARDAVKDVYDTYERGDLLVDQGQEIEEEQLTLLRLEQEKANGALSWTARLRRAASIIVLVGALFALIGYYVHRHEPAIAESLPQIITLCGLIVGTIGMVRLLAPWDAELIPVALAAMILAIAYNPNSALMVAFTLCVLTSLTLGTGIESFLVMMGGTAAGVLPLGEMRTRTKSIKVGAAAALGYFVLTWATDLWMNQPIALVVKDSAWRAGCGLMAGLLLGGLLPFVESAFGMITGISLLELGDITHPLLQELVRRAPGTHNHSVTVGTIAEAAAERIAANALLVRIGAYFHDIGKMLKPHYFVENQAGAANRHANLAPAMSTLIIIGHVKDGVDLGRQHHLPEPIIDLIEQHHGTTLVEYFYREATRRSDGNPDAPSVQESAFRYPGPKPQSKEAGILMVADAVESASRTLSEPTPARIEGLVSELVEKRLDDGQFDECGLTLREIAEIRESLIKSLIGIYHGRVKYPEQRTA